MRSTAKLLAAVIAAGLLSHGAVAVADEIPPQTTPVESKAPTASTADAAVKSGIPLTSNTIANIAEKLAPAVVNIESDKEMVARAIPTSGNPFFDMMNQLNGGGADGPFEFSYNGQRMTPGQMQNRKRPVRRQIGTGFVIRPDGYILTNAHVVKGASKITVTMSDKRVVNGTIVGIDGYSDLAVIKIAGTNLPSVTMGDSDTIRPGEFAIAIGSPQALDHSVTLGIISAVGRTISDVNGNINFIQTDAAINYGNSGGPLLNLTGEVIGVNTAIKLNAQNIGFSIPINVAKTVSADLITNKFVQRPWLGISMQPMDETWAKTLGISSDTKGVVVSQAISNSPAQKAGLVNGDIIQKIEGKSVDTPKAIQDIVHAHKVGDSLHLAIVHKEVLKAVTLQIGQYPDHIPGAREEDDD